MSGTAFESRAEGMQNHAPPQSDGAYYQILSDSQAAVARPMSSKTPETSSVNAVRIALARPLRRLFDYSVPEGMNVAPGQRVRVPFGPHHLTGIVVSRCAEATTEFKLKPIDKVLDEDALIPQDLLDLLSWAARYYQHPPGECLFAALPPQLRTARAAELPQPERWFANTTGAPDIPARAHRQRALLDWLSAQPQGADKATIDAAGFNQTLLTALAARGLAFSRPVEPETLTTTGEPLVALNPAQQQVLEAIPPPDEGFSTTLVYGVTGSGKTEVYLHYLNTWLDDTSQALVMVPEINLTPQTVNRFRRHFGERIIVWHSALNDTERTRAWLRVQRGEPLIVVGTRSAILLPFRKLKTLIVDEEHDSSYKQNEGFRYSGRDLAVYRGQVAACPVILGTATPSLESLHNVRLGRYQMLKLVQRAASAKPPKIRILDIRSRPLDGGLSRPLIDEIGQRVEAGDQVLVFINRRGFAPVMMCFDCGHIMECPHCDSRLALHRQDQLLHCHHCDFRMRATPQCPKCESGKLSPVGEGTERTEEVLQQHFPNTPVLRVDRDSTRRKGSMEQILESVHQGAPCILVGTQMLAKGHDFPNVTLVAVVNADGGLFSVDFRAPEQLLQTLTQVSGRAGRGEKEGHVLIQTCHGEHPLLQGLADNDYLGLARQLLDERAEAELPPASFMAIIRAEAVDMAQSVELLDALSQHVLASGGDIQVLGPLPSVMARKAGRYRAQLIFQAATRKPLHAQLQNACLWLEQQKLPRHLRWQVDVDPTETG